MSKFKIIVDIDRDLFDETLDKKLIYYSNQNQEYYDSVIYSKNIIKIYGNRSKTIDNIRLLETMNSTYYSDLVKALLFAYFKKRPFIINNVKVYIEEDLVNEYSKCDINQVFSNEKLIEIETDILFKETKASYVAMNSLMHLTMSFKYQDLRFDYTWKAFNRLISYFFYKNTDFCMLQELRKDLESNQNSYTNIINFSKGLDYEYLNACFFKGMIYNNFPSKKTKAFVKFLEGFDDYRVIKVLMDMIEYKINDLKDTNEYENIKNDYINKLESPYQKDTDVVRILILKYAYYLRCKFFHAEKLPSNFIINNVHHIELCRISHPLSLICKDLLENKL